MSKLTKIFLICILTLCTVSCTQILQNVDLKINIEDNSEQEDFKVVEKTLTIKEAQKQKNTPYSRKLLKVGKGEASQPIPESIALKSRFPKNEAPVNYKIGKGDTITFSRLIENNRLFNEMPTKWPKEQSKPNYKLGIGDTLSLVLIKQVKSEPSMTPLVDSDSIVVTTQPSVEKTINSTGRIGSDGIVFLLEVGRLEANGKTLDEIRAEVRNILIRDSVSPRFQLEITDFKSQKAYLTINSTSKIVFLEDQVITIKDLLTSANIGFQQEIITRIRLQRNNKEYLIPLREIYSEKAPNLNIQSGDHIFVENGSARIMTSSSVVDHRGYVVFESVGEIKAVGRTLEDLRDEIENSIQNIPNFQNTFQIQISNFSSQKALVSIPGQPGKVITITDKPVTLLDVLTQNAMSVDANSVAHILLQRDSESYTFNYDDLLNLKRPKVYLQSGDHVSVEIMQYKENKVFILGGISPRIFKINPSKRETLADVLFTNGGVLSTSGAKRSEVYLLRGSDPVVAYHLDAQSPTRLIVADAMELRPNDILYVAEQPIMSFNRTLSTILPLRILLRDIKDENIP